MGDTTGWVTTTPTCQTVTVVGEQTSTVSVGNFQKGSVTGCKYNDFNGDGERQRSYETGLIDEPQMSGWTIRLYNSEWEKIDEKVTNPTYTFNGQMEKGTYYLCEQMQNGWTQTEPNQTRESGYTVVENRSGDASEGRFCKQVTVENSGFYGSHYYGFGNRRVDASLTISRSNNSVNSLAPGSSVEHTITINVSENNISNLKLTDLLPKGFTFRVGSYSVVKNGTDTVTLASSPEYHSPGVWELGDYQKDDVITIKYIADITGDIQPGIYSDLAWAEANDAYEQGLNFYATGVDSKFISDTFVGSDVEIIKDQTNSETYGVEKKEEKIGEVLGANTDLPATGANELWVLGALLSLVFGIKLLRSSK